MKYNVISKNGKFLFGESWRNGKKIFHWTTKLDKAWKFPIDETDVGNADTYAKLTKGKIITY